MGNDLCMPSNLSIDDTYHDFIYTKADTTIESISSTEGGWRGAHFKSPLLIIYSEL